MSKNLIYIIFFIVLLIFYIYGFSVSYTSHNISNLAYVLALGIDKGENAKLKISAQFAKNTISSENGSSDSSSNNILTACEADSIFSALNILNSYIGKEINLAHCSVIIFSEEIAKEGLYNEVYSIANNEEIRPSTNFVISNCSAYDYLNNTNPIIENLTTKYFDTFSITSRFTGYFSNITIGNFFHNLVKGNYDSTAIMGGLNLTARSEENKQDSGNNNSSEDSSDSSDTSNRNSSSQNFENSSNQNVQITPDNLIAGSSSIVGKRGNENLGLAVFNKDKYCGQLTATETICHLLIANEINTCIFTISNPFNENDSIEVQIIPEKKSKISSNYDNDNFKFVINLYLNANIIDIEKNLNFEDPEVLEKFATSLTNSLNSKFEKYFNKVSKEYNSDIDKFYLSILKYFPTQDSLNNLDWKQKYMNSEFSCNININNISSLLITKS